MAMMRGSKDGGGNAVFRGPLAHRQKQCPSASVQLPRRHRHTLEQNTGGGACVRSAPNFAS